MKLLITGGAGFVGARLARTLLARATLAGRPIGQLVLADQAGAPPDLLADRRVQERVGPLLAQCAALRDEDFDGVFHLASAVSGECEADFDMKLLSALNQEGTTIIQVTHDTRVADFSRRVVELADGWLTADRGVTSPKD